MTMSVPPPTPLVAILILNWNNYQDTKTCLESLESLTYRYLKVILVDNGSDDGSLELLREHFPHLTILTSESNLGFAGGNNIGLRYILEEDIPYVLLLNNDTEVIKPDFLEIILQVIESDDEICAVGPKVSCLDGTPDRVILPFPTLDVTLRTSLGLFKEHLDHRQVVDSLTGCCVLVRMEAVRRVGLLDENYFMYVEETEWFFRMRKAGCKIVYFPEESVLHKVGSSSRKLESRPMYIERRANVVYTLVKHRMPVQAAVTAVLMTFLLCLRTLAGYLVSSSSTRERYQFSAIPSLIAEISRKWQLARQAATQTSQ